MERLSIFDIYKIGVGPSSSHTLGPWKAALAFAQTIQETAYNRIEIHLFGSLAQTGKGHGTDIAVQLGLEGFDPKIIDTDRINMYITHIRNQCILQINGKNLSFNPRNDIHFHPQPLERHPNALTFRIFNDDIQVLQETYYSVGGGFIHKDGDPDISDDQPVLPYPIDTGRDLFDHILKTGSCISDIVYANECAFRSKEDIEFKINEIFETMVACVYKGCHTEGVLPGGLNVKRRACQLNKKHVGDAMYTNASEWLEAIKKLPQNFDRINKFISCFALAVNEENAALGRVVTSPTNGAAGVIPAVLLYYYCFCDFKGMDAVHRFLYTSGEIGCLFKKGATISAAVGGCQAEIGVSSAMAAGGLTEVLGGTPRQVLMAAEIAMEHHLGLTCDPIGGLVQIPCIERNTMGAVKAITAAHLALDGNPEDAIINFDLIVKTMWDTAIDMNTKYKETAQGGLAFNLPVAFPDC